MKCLRTAVHRMRTALLLMLPLAAGAQPVLDIGLFSAGTPNTLEVRVKPNGSSFDQVVSGLTFTLRWNAASGAQPGAIVQNIDGNLCPLFRVALAADPAGVQTVGGFRYLTYNGFSTATLSSCPASPGYSFPAEVETVIARIPVTPGADCAQFAIVNDGYTAAENKDFFAELNGLDRTGQILTAAAPVAVDGNTTPCAQDCASGPEAVIQAPDFAIAGQSTTFSALPDGADLYLWDLGDGTQAQGQEVSHAYAMAGTYTVQLVVTVGTCSDTAVVDLLVDQSTVATEQHMHQGHRAWYDGQALWIRGAKDCSGPLWAELLDATGRLTWAGTIPCAGESYRLPHSAITTGIWFIRLWTKEQAQTLRIPVVER